MKIQNCSHAITSSLRKIIEEIVTPPLPGCGSEVVQSEESCECGQPCVHFDLLTEQIMLVLGLRTIHTDEEFSFKWKAGK